MCKYAGHSVCRYELFRIINKKGEFLDSVTLADKVKGVVEHIFNYVTGKLTDVTFEVYAEEDIKAADGVSDDYYKKDELIATIKTDETGIAKLENLPLGKYYVKETGTAYGHVLDGEIRHVDLTYMDQNTPVVVYDKDWQNNLQRVEVSVLKKEKDSDRTLEGAIFGLFAKEDIKSETTGKVLIEANEIIELKSTDEEGKITFVADLPIGATYYVKELYLPYQEARQQNVSITVENYRVISIHEMQEEEKVADIWKRMKKQCEVSDVLVLNRDGEINCYYVDENYPQYLAGFIRINTSGALITMETENYQIDGKKGNWIATDTIIIDGKQFYLMEHQVYRDQAQGVILDAYGKMVVEECKKFDEKTKQKIHNYIQQQAPLNSVEQLKQDGQIRLEHYQKFYQNGTYERSRESGTEANYDMVDGLVNNQKRNQEKTFDARSNKQTSRNEQDNKPKKRRSVIKRLHQKQIAIARRSGKPIPKYLDQEMERKRG